jgi:hypothetical protein
MHKKTLESQTRRLNRSQYRPFGRAESDRQFKHVNAALADDR